MAQATNVSCDCMNAVCVDSTEAKESGRFVERYECPDCGRKGRIEGQEENPPSTWKRTGAVFFE